MTRLWPRSRNAVKTAPLAANTAAVPVSVEEIDVIAWILTAAWNHEHHLSLTEVSKDSPIPQFIEALHKRIGASAAVTGHGPDDDPAQVPLFEHEVDSVAKAVQTVRSSYHQRTIPEVVAAAELVTKLHWRLGHAIATRSLGGIAVFAREIEPPASH